MRAEFDLHIHSAWFDKLTMREVGGCRANLQR
jgi:hypothetical protein